MQNQATNYLIRDRFSIVRHPKSRKVLPMPVLSVHSRQKHGEQLDQQSKLRKIFCERFKDRKDIKDILGIIQSIPSAQCSILKNVNSKELIEANKSIEFRTKYKTNYKTLTNRSFRKQRQEAENDKNDKNEGETHQNKKLQRLLKKLSRKNPIRQNLSLIMQRQKEADLKYSLNRKTMLRYENLRQTFSSKLMPSCIPHQLARYSLKKELISRRSRQKDDEKNYKSLYKTLVKGVHKTMHQGQLDGWQTNQQNKELDELNVCSFETEQL